MHGEENEFIEPGYGVTKWHNQLKDKEIERKLPKAATTKALQHDQRKYGRDEWPYKKGKPIGGAAPKSTQDIPGAPAHKPNVGVTKEESEMNPLIRATIDKIHSMREDKLSYKERQKLPSGDFALPGKGTGPEGKQGGSYPIPDESHARNALARVSQHGTSAEKAKVKAAVERKFPGIKVSEDSEVDEASVTGITVSKKMAGTTVPPKQAPRSQRMDKSKNLFPVPGFKTRKAGNKPGEMSLGEYDPTLGESKAAEEGERDVGSDAYANYVKDITPGQEPNIDVTNKDAKKANSESKKSANERERSTRIDDEYVPSLEEFAAHLETLDRRSS